MILGVKDGCKTSMLLALLVSCLNSNFNLNFFDESFCAGIPVTNLTHGMQWKIAWNHMVCLAYR